MGCCGKIVLAIFVFFAQVLKAGCAIAIIVITATKLQTSLDVTIDDSGTIVWTEVCQLADKDGQSLCIYAYAVAGISLALNLLMSLFLCLTCDLCGLGPILEAIFSGLGMLWWLAASLVFWSYVKDANDAHPEYYPETHNWRLAIVALCWAAFGMFTFVFFVYIGKMIAKCCACCNACDDDDDAKSKAYATA
ncbi:hypothetical protein FOA52_004986 [Chlamydomonas sp. UWO 241]|nr:hypothetical protein FOA52_004986 [Chlamydomonas sp. UWO 241]